MSQPGGAYVSIGFQFGKDSNMNKYRDIQLSTGLSLGLLDEIGIPAFLFPGITVGKRTINDNTQYIFKDFQIQLSGLLSIGVGRGTIRIDNKKIPRKKIWIGSFFFPLAYTSDIYIYGNAKVKNNGTIIIIPFPYFSGDFTP